MKGMSKSAKRCGSVAASMKNGKEGKGNKDDSKMDLKMMIMMGTKKKKKK